MGEDGGPQLILIHTHICQSTRKSAISLPFLRVLLQLFTMLILTHTLTLRRFNKHWGLEERRAIITLLISPPQESCMQLGLNT